MLFKIEEIIRRNQLRHGDAYIPYAIHVPAYATVAIHMQLETLRDPMSENTPARSTLIFEDRSMNKNAIRFYYERVSPESPTSHIYVGGSVGEPWDISDIDLTN